MVSSLVSGPKDTTWGGVGAPPVESVSIRDTGSVDSMSDGDPHGSSVSTRLDAADSAGGVLTFSAPHGLPRLLRRMAQHVPGLRIELETQGLLEEATNEYETLRKAYHASGIGKEPGDQSGRPPVPPRWAPWLRVRLMVESLAIPLLASMKNRKDEREGGTLYKSIDRLADSLAGTCERLRKRCDHSNSEQGYAKYWLNRYAARAFGDQLPYPEPSKSENEPLLQGFALRMMNRLCQKKGAKSTGLVYSLQKGSPQRWAPVEVTKMVEALGAHRDRLTAPLRELPVSFDLALAITTEQVLCVPVVDEIGVLDLCEMSLSLRATTQSGVASGGSVALSMSEIVLPRTTWTGGRFRIFPSNRVVQYGSCALSHLAPTSPAQDFRREKHHGRSARRGNEPGPLISDPAFRGRARFRLPLVPTFRPSLGPPRRIPRLVERFFSAPPDLRAARPFGITPDWFSRPIVTTSAEVNKLEPCHNYSHERRQRADRGETTDRTRPLVGPDSPFPALRELPPPDGPRPRPQYVDGPLTWDCVLGPRLVAAIERNRHEAETYRQFAQKAAFQVNAGCDGIVSVIPLAEPAKVRIITSGNAYAGTALQPLQKDLLLRWKRCPSATMDADDRTTQVNLVYARTLAAWSRYDKNALQRAWAPLPVKRDGQLLAVSGDFKASTDLIFRSCSTRILEVLLRRSRLSDATLRQSGKGSGRTRLIEFALAQQRRDFIGKYPPWSKLEPARFTEGQLMGHQLSFPLLCVANLSSYRNAICKWVFSMRPSDSYCRTQDSFTRAALVKPDDDLTRLAHELCRAVIVNGDDILFFCYSEFYPFWQSETVSIGLHPSAGKNYLSPFVAQINSQIFVHQEKGAPPGTGPWVRTGYINQRIMTGLNPKTGASHTTPTEAAASLSHVSLVFPLNMDFLSVTMRRFAKSLSGYQPNWFFPASLGGLGIDPKYCDKGAVSATRNQIRLASVLVHRPDLTILEPLDLVENLSAARQFGLTPTCPSRWDEDTTIEGPTRDSEEAWNSYGLSYLKGAADSEMTGIAQYTDTYVATAIARSKTGDAELVRGRKAIRSVVRGVRAPRLDIPTILGFAGRKKLYPLRGGRVTKPSLSTVWRDLGDSPSAALPTNSLLGSKDDLGVMTPPSELPLLSRPLDPFRPFEGGRFHYVEKGKGLLVDELITLVGEQFPQVKGRSSLWLPRFATRAQHLSDYSAFEPQFFPRDPYQVIQRGLHKLALLSPFEAWVLSQEGGESGIRAASYAFVFANASYRADRILNELRKSASRLYPNAARIAVQALDPLLSLHLQEIDRSAPPGQEHWPRGPSE